MALYVERVTLRVKDQFYVAVRYSINSSAMARTSPTVTARLANCTGGSVRQRTK